MSESDEEHYTVPLKDQRYFGAGIKRKRVNFVPSSTNSSLKATPSPASGLSASEAYLNIVFRKSASESATPLPKSTTDASALASVPATTSEDNVTKPPQVCDVCKAPVDSRDEAKHASSLVHQICLPHAHPPSALDRRRTGMSILQAYGWDPDQRRGLGAQGEGILHPVKAKEKRDTVGLGVAAWDEESRKKKRPAEKKDPVKKLDAGKIRKMEQDQKKKDQKLRDLFYASEDVERYLASG